jgi:hypothetical protein
VRRRAPASLSKLLSIDQASNGKHARPIAPSIECMSVPRNAAVRSSRPGRWAAAI